jgi:hypothetical protein
MLGVFPEVEWSRPIENGWKARVVIKTRQGEIISAGEAMCTRDETNWSNRDDFALLSMAQTRAAGKAFRLSFSWIITLSGYEPTPAEELEEIEAERTRMATTNRPFVDDDGLITDKQKEFLIRIAGSQLEEVEKKVGPIEMLTKEQATKVINEILRRKEEKKKQENKEVVEQDGEGN